jgi:hypothetical protein
LEKTIKNLTKKNLRIKSLYEASNLEL